MNGYTRSIDTDAGIGTILSHFDSAYIEHIVSDSLQMKYRPFSNAPMPNIIDILQRELNVVRVYSLDYIEQVTQVKMESYKEIIRMICNYYNLTFTGDMDSFNENELYTVAHTLYDIFISRFTEYMIDFFVSYIIKNADSIYSSLMSDETSIRPKESGVYAAKNYIDPKFIMIHANTNKVMYNMAAYDISLYELLQYFLGREGGIISSYLVDNGDIYKNHYAVYILNQNSAAGILTNVKLALQSRTIEAMQIQ